MRFENNHLTGNTQSENPHVWFDAHTCVHTQTFAYGGWNFLIGAEGIEGKRFRPVVHYFAAPTRELKTLSVNEDPCATAADAVRRAELAAIQWFQGRLGDGKGQN